MADEGRDNGEEKGGAAAKAACRLVSVTLDPTERHGFEYQSWIGFSLFARGVRGEIGRGGSYSVLGAHGEEPAVGFSLYAEGVRGALGRGGTYLIKGSDEAATGFSLYIDQLLGALAEPAG